MAPFGRFKGVFLGGKPTQAKKLKVIYRKAIYNTKK
jgi:hypothetical protein